MLSCSNNALVGESRVFLSILWDVGHEAVSWSVLPPLCIVKGHSLFLAVDPPLPPGAVPLMAFRSSMVMAKDDEVGRLLPRLPRQPDLN